MMLMMLVVILVPARHWCILTIRVMDENNKIKIERRRSMNFGTTIAIHKDTIVVGARSADKSKGAAYVFTRNTPGKSRRDGRKALSSWPMTVPRAINSVSISATPSSSARRTTTTKGPTAEARTSSRAMFPEVHVGMDGAGEYAVRRHR